MPARLSRDTHPRECLKNQKKSRNTTRDTKRGVAFATQRLKRQAQTSRSQRLTVHNNKTRKARLHTHILRTTSWRLYKSPIMSHSRLLQPIVFPSFSHSTGPSSFFFSLHVCAFLWIRSPASIFDVVLVILTTFPSACLCRSWLVFGTTRCRLLCVRRFMISTHVVSSFTRLSLGGLFTCAFFNPLTRSRTFPRHGKTTTQHHQHARTHTTTPTTPTTPTNHTTPHHTTPHHTTPRRAAPRRATPRHATPRHATPHTAHTHTPNTTTQQQHTTTHNKTQHHNTTTPQHHTTSHHNTPPSAIHDIEKCRV